MDEKKNQSQLLFHETNLFKEKIMKHKANKFTLLSVLIVIVTLLSSAGVSAAGLPIYDAIPNPLPPNLPSLGYQATSTAEFGDYIAFAGTGRTLSSVTVTMSNWALHSTYPSMDAAGYMHPITLNIYNVDLTGTTPAVGSLIATATQSFLIPWRPEADPTCAGGTAWRAGDGLCYNGYAFNIVFDLASQGITLPDQIIYGIAYNTNTWGYAPIGAAGPYESLNVGLNSAAPAVGTDMEADAVFWNTKYGGFYADGGAGGTGTFRHDTNWTPYTPAVRFETSLPVPTSANECKKDGWKILVRSDGSSFKNQGDCIQFVNTGK